MTSFDRIEFLNSLQNPSTLYDFIVNLETLVHNGEYSYSNSLSLFQNLFPNIKSAKGLRYTIKRKYKDENLAESLYELVFSSKKTDCSFYSSWTQLFIIIYKRGLIFPFNFYSI